jgi:hypothetical protein
MDFWFSFGGVIAVFMLLGDPGPKSVEAASVFIGQGDCEINVRQSKRFQIDQEAALFWVERCEG